MSDSSSAASKVLIRVGVGLAVTLLTGGAYYAYKKILEQRIPQKWRRVGTLKHLNFFPIKSGGPLKLPSDTELNCELLGLKFGNIRDKSFIIIDNDYRVVTARGYPKLVLIKSQPINESKILLSAPNMPDIEVDLIEIGKQAGKDIQVKWTVPLTAMLCGEKYDKWFSQYVFGTDTGLYFAYYPYDRPMRGITPNMKIHSVKLKDVGTFFDETSYMLMNIASVDDLNKRLLRPVSSLQFRGSFDLEMDEDEPYAEDHWQWLKIGDDAIFKVIAPCTRCIIPNVNPDTGERDPEMEPQKTLRTYRTFPKLKNPVLGIHLGLRQEGKVKLNDAIYVADI